MYNNELYHHGILGQRWGVRRFQNTDGSLKPAGEKRYYGEHSLNAKYEKITGEKKPRSRRGGIRDTLAAVGAGLSGIGVGAASIAGAKAALNYKGEGKAKQEAMAAPVNMLRDSADASRNLYRMSDDSMTINALKKANKLDLSKATDQELRDYITRYRLEREFKDLTARETASGMSRTESVLNTIGGVTSTASSVMDMVMTYQNLKNGYFGGDDKKKK